MLSHHRLLLKLRATGNAATSIPALHTLGDTIHPHPTLTIFMMFSRKFWEVEGKLCLSHTTPTTSSSNKVRRLVKLSLKENYDKILAVLLLFLFHTDTCPVQLE